MKELAQIVSLFFGSMGFALIFNLNRKTILYASLGGAFSWIAYLIAQYFGFSLEIKYFIAALFLGLYSEIMARVLRKPATLFWVVGFIPLIPGFSLYHTMHCIVENDIKGFNHFGIETITIASSLAIGIICSLSVFKFINNIFLIRLNKYFSNRR